MTDEEMAHVSTVTGRLHNELDDARERIKEATSRVRYVVDNARRHRAQALALGIILGYAAGVWTALGAQ